MNLKQTLIYFYLLYRRRYNDDGDKIKLSSSIELQLEVIRTSAVYLAFIINPKKSRNIYFDLSATSHLDNSYSYYT